jgi:hypothetical protein
MDSEPLVSEQIDAGAKFLAEFGKYAPVLAAFWVKHSDDSHWSLYVASDQINDDNYGLAYGEVLRLTTQPPAVPLDPFLVTVVGADDPLAQAVLELMKKHTGRSPIRANGRSLGGLSIDGVYVYPMPIAVGS